MKNNKECIDKLLKDTKTILIATDNGVGITGNLISILGSFSMMVNKLIEGGISEKQLRQAFDLGVMTDKEVEKETDKITKKTAEAKKELKEIIKGLTEALTKNLEEMFGDEENE